MLFNPFAQQQLAPPSEVLPVIQGIKELDLEQETSLFQVDSDYYQWELEQRRQALDAPSIDHLCKSVVFENTKWKEDDPNDPSSVRYIMVVVQYVDKINSQKLNNYVRALMEPPRSRKNFNMRVTGGDVALDLTGYSPGGINPFGLKTPLPIYITCNIDKLDPPIFYLGGGHVDWKVGVKLEAFKTATGCHVV